MLTALSILFGLVASALALPGLLPFLGLLNWLALPFAGLGVALGAFARGNFGRNFNIVVLVVATVRLSLGGGLL